jgi:hypothetical protein
MKTKSIGKVFSCFDCSVKIKHELRVQLKCPVIEMDTPINFESGIFHDDCPFEDHEKSCDCEPFQPCEKCTVKKVWLPICEIKEYGVNYWLLDPNNTIGRGFLTIYNKIIYDPDFTSDDFTEAVMFTEIKPPEPPCLNDK